MLHLGIKINTINTTLGLRVPTDRSGVGTVNSNLKTDPDRGFRGTDRNEVIVEKLSKN